LPDRTAPGVGKEDTSDDPVPGNDSRPDPGDEDDKNNFSLIFQFTQSDA
jgi:hypothetical protein